MVPRKGYDEWIVKTIDGFGYGRVILKTDNEPALISLRDEVCRALAQTVVPETPPPPPLVSGPIPPV